MAKLSGKQSKEMHQFAQIMKAMAHVDRLTILKLLYDSEEKRLTVKSIYVALRLQQPVVSRHLNIMKSAGVVRRLQEGQKIYYCLCQDQKNIQGLTQCLC